MATVTRKRPRNKAVGPPPIRVYLIDAKDLPDKPEYYAESIDEVMGFIEKWCNLEVEKHTGVCPVVRVVKGGAV